MLKPLIDKPRAPIVFFDSAEPVRVYSGAVHITLVAAIFEDGRAGGEKLRPAVAAYLRCSIAGAVALRTAIDDAMMRLDELRSPGVEPLG